MTYRNRTTADWKAADTAHYLHPFTDFKALAAEGGSRIITSAEGVWLTDSEGRRMLDGMAGLWCVNVGYGRPELVEAARRQMEELPFYNSFFKTTTPASVALTERLAALAPEGLGRVMLANSGSEAVDTAVRLVRHFWALDGKPERRTIIGRLYGYHGSTMAGASVGGMHPMHRQAGLPLPGFAHILPPYWYDFGRDLTPEEFGLEAARWLEERILAEGPESIAAFFAEPIQGAGGVIIPPETYWPEIQRICRKYDVLLVADEVICGFGRTGHWFGCDRYGIAPDLMTVAKAVTSGYQPLSGVLVGDRVAETLIEKGREFFHGFTYSGHPVACAVGVANLDLIEREGLVERTREVTGPHLRRRLEEIFADHPIVGEVRSEGLIGAVELVVDKGKRARFPDYGKTGTRVRDHCFARDVVLRAVRDTLVMSPPLSITTEEIDEMLARAKDAVDATARDLGRG